VVRKYGYSLAARNPQILADAQYLRVYVRQLRQRRSKPIPTGRNTLARLNKPIDFKAIDGRPVDLVFLLLLPANPVGQQLKALASVARKLRDPACLRDLRSSSGAPNLYDVMTA